jgi:creatinine amidohydrolase/Fe(II)-dependent formamide hydrolase-like protein
MTAAAAAETRARRMMARMAGPLRRGASWAHPKMSGGQEVALRFRRVGVLVDMQKTF